MGSTSWPISSKHIYSVRGRIYSSIDIIDVQSNTLDRKIWKQTQNNCKFSRYYFPCRFGSLEHRRTLEFQVQLEWESQTRRGASQKRRKILAGDRFWDAKGLKPVEKRTESQIRRANAAQRKGNVRFRTYASNTRTVEFCALCPDPATQARAHVRVACVHKRKRGSTLCVVRQAACGTVVVHTQQGRRTSSPPEQVWGVLGLVIEWNYMRHNRNSSALCQRNPPRRSCRQTQTRARPIPHNQKVPGSWSAIFPARLHYAALRRLTATN